MAGVDPGTVSFDLCVLQDGEPVVEAVFPSASLSRDPAPLLAALDAHGPFDLVYGPSGYGLPLVAGTAVGPAELALIVLVRPDESGAAAGIGGLRALVRDLCESGHPLVFGPGVRHLRSVPPWRRRNRIDLGTADKVCAVACALRESDGDPARASFTLLELGGAFTAALAVREGRIVDGSGGSGGPPGARAAGALDGELAYLLGAALTKDTLFSGGALGDGGWAGADAEGRALFLEGAEKAARALRASLGGPGPVRVSGRWAREPAVVHALAERLADLGPVSALVPGRASAAARGGALLADGLCGGRHADLIDALALRDCGGSVLDDLTVDGAAAIRLG